MYFKFIETRHPILKKYLEGFYIFDTAGLTKTLEYLVFPSNHTIISTYAATEICIGSDRVVFKQNKKKTCCSTIAYGLEQPVTGIYGNNIREISFCFYPLGFNHFIKKNLGNYYKSGIGIFDLYEDFEPLVKILLKEQDEHLLQQKAESYWLYKLQQRDFSLLESIIHELQNNTELSIEKMADKTGISRQHINRLFSKHIGKSPACFRKIARFRQTLQNRIQKLHAQKNLTHLTYESLFYDQSHLIKDFKSLTGMTPKKFFNGNKAFKEGNINWYFPS